jgi:hypothetical protein
MTTILAKRFEVNKGCTEKDFSSLRTTLTGKEIKKISEQMTENFSIKQGFKVSCPRIPKTTLFHYQTATKCEIFSMQINTSHVAKTNKSWKEISLDGEKSYRPTDNCSLRTKRGNQRHFI